MTSNDAGHVVLSENGARATGTQRCHSQIDTHAEAVPRVGDIVGNTPGLPPLTKPQVRSQRVGTNGPRAGLDFLSVRAFEIRASSRG